MLDEMTRAQLHTMMKKAMEKAEEKMDDHCYESAHWLMEIVRDCDEICREHWVMEHHPEMMR